MLSVDHMIQLIDIEKRFATSLHEYIEELERQAELLKRYGKFMRV